MNNIEAAPPPAFCYDSDHVERCWLNRTTAGRSLWGRGALAGRNRHHGPFPRPFVHASRTYTPENDCSRVMRPAARGRIAEPPARCDLAIVPAPAEFAGSDCFERTTGVPGDFGHRRRVRPNRSWTDHHSFRDSCCRLFQDQAGDANGRILLIPLGGKTLFDRDLEFALLGCS
jgi:hypothetical protein